MLWVTASKIIPLQSQRLLQDAFRKKKRGSVHKICDGDHIKLHSWTKYQILEEITNQYAENTSNSVEGADSPQTVNRVKKESHWWSSNEEGRDASESLRTATSISSQPTSPVFPCSSLLFLEDIRLSKTPLFMKVELNLFWIECRPEVNWRGTFSGVFKPSSNSLRNDGVSNIFESEMEGPQLWFCFLVINHFSNTEDKCDTAIFSLWIPIAHVVEFLGEGLSSNNSKESTSWKYARSLSKFGGWTNFPCK